MLIPHKGHTDTIQVYSVTVMTHVKALQAGHSSQGTSEPITGSLKRAGPGYPNFGLVLRPMYFLVWLDLAWTDPSLTGTSSSLSYRGNSGCLAQQCVILWMFNAIWFLWYTSTELGTLSGRESRRLLMFHIMNGEHICLRTICRCWNDDADTLGFSSFSGIGRSRHARYLSPAGSCS